MTIVHPRMVSGVKIWEQTIASNIMSAVIIRGWLHATISSANFLTYSSYNLQVWWTN